MVSVDVKYHVYFLSFTHPFTGIYSFNSHIKTNHKSNSKQTKMNEMEVLQVYTCTHAKRSHSHVKDPVVHIGGQLFVETPKQSRIDWKCQSGQSAEVGQSMEEVEEREEGTGYHHGHAEIKENGRERERVREMVGGGGGESEGEKERGERGGEREREWEGGERERMEREGVGGEREWGDRGGEREREGGMEGGRDRETERDRERERETERQRKRHTESVCVCVWERESMGNTFSAWTVTRLINQILC